MDWKSDDAKLQVNAGSFLETHSAKVCPVGYKADGKKKEIKCAKNSPSFKP